ncbi:MAG: N-acetylmuramoyl-L-alanine amidase [Pseudomonadota bacterium]
MTYVLTLCLALPALGQTLSGLSRATDLNARTTFAGQTDLRISIDRAVPYAIDLLANPNRIRLRFRAVSFESVAPETLARAEDIVSVQVGQKGTSETWLDLELAQTLGVSVAQMIAQGDGSSILSVLLTPIADPVFAGLVEADIADPAPQAVSNMPPLTRNAGDRPWVVALDPGHGGIDPGADGGRKSEADLMLLFAFELRDALRRVGFDVILTRDADVFVGLESRVSLARTARADVLLSLHADAVLEGVAEGPTLYTLTDASNAEANAKLAARHDRFDILGGVDFSGQGDEVAEVLMDMVRLETRPRSQALAQALHDGLVGTDTVMNSNPVRMGDFAVLRAADIPSVLVELGFLSSARDLARLHDPAGRAGLIRGVVAGLTVWADQDAADAALIRQ